MTQSPSRSSRYSVVIVALLVWAFWLTGMVVGSRFGLFEDNWFMSATMVLGSFIAGATSEGGGAVAFPVMTLFFEIPPAVARDFSLMIQAVGMTAAATTIFWMGVRVERNALIWSTLGGAFGIALGLNYVAPHMQPAFAKMTFLAVWLAFAFALFWINRYSDREVRPCIERFGARHGAMLFGTGIAGGVITSITGSGLDIITFSLLTLRFRVDEKVATPTSVILMAANAAVGFAFKATVMEGGMEPRAWDFWWVCVPIVVVGAPFGARFIKNRSRHFVAGILYVSIAIQFIAGLAIIPQNPKLVGYWVSVLVLSLLFFRWMSQGGLKRLNWLSSSDPEQTPSA